MCSIPGLSFIPTDGHENNVIEIPSFRGTIRVPEAHRYGNCRPRDSFEKLGIIYEGNFGTVYKCRDKRNGQIYALKKFIFPEEMLKNGMPVSFLREINVLKILKHDNIVNSHGTVAGKKLESNFLLLDYCVSSLHELMEKKCDAIYEKDIVKYMMRQLFDGINFIHECTIVHRNISCRNLLFTECGTLKISGFRTARYYDKRGMSPVVTELTFRAPELLLKAKYGLPADMWSVGCVFAHLLLKKPLFTGESEMAVLKSMFNILGTPSEGIWPGLDKILDKGGPDEKIISKNQPFADLKNILVGIPELGSQLLQDIIVYYPDVRMKANFLLKSPYIVEPPAECTSEKMASIISRSFSASELLEVPMHVDG